MLAQKIQNHMFPTDRAEPTWQGYVMLAVLMFIALC